MLPGVSAIVISAFNSQKHTPNISAPVKKLIKFDKKVAENSFFCKVCSKRLRFS